MIIAESKGPLAAVSYDTATFKLLDSWVQKDTGCNLIRLEPEQFFQEPNRNYQYINLVLKDFTERKQISEFLDQQDLPRWGYQHQGAGFYNNVSARQFCTVKPGGILYPFVMAYYATIERDVVVHGRTSLAEGVHIGQGSFLSGEIAIGGNSTLGNYCWVGMRATILDNVKICDQVKILPHMVVRKSISSPGAYYNPYSLKMSQFSGGTGWMDF